MSSHWQQQLDVVARSAARKEVGLVRAAQLAPLRERRRGTREGRRARRRSERERRDEVIRRPISTTASILGSVE